MKIGCHVSIAGGICNAPERASVLGCEVFQMFTRSPQGGSAPEINNEVVKKFKEEMKKWRQSDCYIHAPYYINLASANPKTREASVRVIREELERGSFIGAKYLMTHLGSSTSFKKAQDELLTASNSQDPEEEALKLVADGIRAVMKAYEGTTIFLLEISAGSGNIIGNTFEELCQILDYIKMHDVMTYHNIGICLDSAHMFASGYDIKSKAGFEATINVIKNTVGMEKIKLIHANDSKVGLGEKKDRHEHVGMGKMGKEGFVNLMTAFSGIDFVLETEHDLVRQDILKLKEIRTKIII